MVSHTKGVLVDAFPDDRAERIARALGMTLDELGNRGNARHISSGSDELKISQSLELMKAFTSIDNPKTRTMVILLIERIACIESFTEDAS